MTQYWFKPKRYGYGATPVTWEGWVVTILAGAFVGGSIIAMNLLVGPANLTVWLLWAVLVAALTFWFAQFTRRRTDGKWRWRWGNRAGTTEI